MSLLARFEGMAEYLFTGAFKKGSARLQPVEIAKELVKAMLKNKQVSISQVYVPNIYRVYLHPSDWGSLANFGDVFLMELSKYLFAEAARNGYTFLTKPAIELHSDETVNPREMVVEVDFDDSIDVDWGDDEEREEKRENEEETEDELDWRESTTIFGECVKLNLGEQNLRGRKSNYFLEIIEGPDKGQSFLLKDGEVFIGRHSQCELVLHDLEVSRRHLKIAPGENSWLLDDLGSTNGSFVNGQRITHHPAFPGDRIQIGQSVLVIQRSPRS